jgi:hypothetical protein
MVRVIRLHGRSIEDGRQPRRRDGHRCEGLSPGPGLDPDAAPPAWLGAVAEAPAALPLILRTPSNERPDPGLGEGRPRLHSLPPRQHARVLLVRDLVGCDLLVDALDEGND